MSEVVAIAPGLHRWTAWHDEWEEDVASVAVETDDGLVVIDPLDPPRQFARPDHVLITIFWHHRSADRLAGARIWATKRGTRRLRNRGVEVTDAVENGARLPAGSRPSRRRVTRRSSTGSRRRRL